MKLKDQKYIDGRDKVLNGSSLMEGKEGKEEWDYEDKGKSE